MSEPQPELRRRASRVTFVLLDVDGVMTDGSVHMMSDGSEGRSFHTQDGLGIRLGRRGGLEFGILSGRESPVVAARAAELGIEELHQRVPRKAERLGEILERRGLAAEEVCFVGDDLVDVPVMRRVGFAVATANAVPEALGAAHLVTRRRGGEGAVREVVDLLLRARGTWDEVTSRYFG